MRNRRPRKRLRRMRSTMMRRGKGGRKIRRRKKIGKKNTEEVVLKM